MKARPGFILRDLVGEKVLMPVGDNIGRFGGALLMNALSAFIWEALQTPVSRDELLRAVLDRYDVDERTAAEDLDRTLAEMDAMGILEM